MGYPRYRESSFSLQYWWVEKRNSELTKVTKKNFVELQITLVFTESMQNLLNVVSSLWKMQRLKL